MRFFMPKRITAIILLAAFFAACLTFTAAAETEVIVSGDPNGAASAGVYGKAETDKALRLTVTSPSLYRTFYQVNPGNTYTNHKYLVYEANIVPESGVKSVYLQTASSARVSAHVTSFNERQWNHFMFVYEVPTDEAPKGRTTCYVNGEAILTDSVNIEAFRGTDVRIAVDSTLTQKIADRQDLYAYVDDIKLYLTDEMPSAPEMPRAENAAGNVIEAADGDTAGMISSGECEVRLYRGKDFSRQLAPEDTVSFGDTAVFEKDEKYSYYTIAIAGKKYLCNDDSGQSFISDTGESTCVTRAFGKDSGDASARFSFAGTSEVLSSVSMEDCREEYRCLIFEMNFVPEYGFDKIILDADSSEIPISSVSDGWVCGRWNNIRYAFDFANENLYIYMNGRLAETYDTDGAQIAAAKKAVIKTVFSGTMHVDDFKVYYSSNENTEPAIPKINEAEYSVRGDVLILDDGAKTADFYAGNAAVRCYTDESFEKEADSGGSLSTGNVLVLQSKDNLYGFYYVLLKRSQEDIKTMDVLLHYNSETNCLDITGKLSLKRKETISLHAAPAAADGKDLCWNFTSDENGTISCTIPFGSSFVAKKYSYVITSESEMKKGEFSAADSKSMADFLTNINAAANADKVKHEIINTAPLAALDNGDSHKDFSYMAELVFSMRPSELYTSDSLINAYMTAEGLSYVKNGKISFAQFLSNYGGYLGSGYAANFNALSDKEQTETAALFKSGLIFKSFSQIYDDVLWISRYRLQETAPALGRFFLDYCDKNGISLEAYNKIKNDYKREQIFASMYSDRKSKYYITDIINEFNALTEEKSTAAVTGGSGGKTSGSAVGSKVSVTQGASADTNRQDSAFTDINGHWAENAINKISAAGIINGFGDNTFRPDRTVTRAEFTKMIISAVEKKKTLPNGENILFSDVSPQSWYSVYIKKALAAEIIQGFDGCFLPEETITREDAAVIMYRCIRLLGKNSDAADLNYLDANDISEYAEEAVSGLTSCGILKGAGNMFFPKKGMTRAEVAEMTVRLLEMKL